MEQASLLIKEFHVTVSSIIISDTIRVNHNHLNDYSEQIYTSVFVEQLTARKIMNESLYVALS